VVQKEIWQLDANLPVTGIRPMEQILSSSLGPDRFNAILLGLFSTLAVLLAAVGLYGVISYTVTQRTHEIGIRVALGAQPADVLRMILTQGAVLSLIGLAIGLAGAFALTRYLETLLFEITATDPAVFLMVSGLLLTVALLACWIPARRAANVDPIIALRAE
jgi:putative ABC transport system permease protein